MSIDWESVNWSEVDWWDLTCDDHSLDALNEGIGQGLEQDEETFEYSILPTVNEECIVDFYVHDSIECSSEVVGCIAFFVSYGFDFSEYYDKIKPHIDKELAHIPEYKKFDREEAGKCRKDILQKLDYAIKNGIIVGQRG